MRRISLENEAFSTQQVVSLVGVSTRKLVHWDKQGLVKPSISPASGRGSRRMYSYRDLLALKVVKGLRDQGVSLQRVRRCVRYLRKHMPDISQPLSLCQLLTDGDSVYLVEDRKTLIDTVARPGHRAVRQIIDIAAFDRELRAQVLRIDRKRVESVSVGEYTYQVEVEPDEDEGGYVAAVGGMPGCITDGRTLEEVLANAKDAIRCWLKAHEELRRRGVEVPREAARKRRRRA